MPPKNSLTKMDDHPTPMIVSPETAFQIVLVVTKEPVSLLGEKP